MKKTTALLLCLFLLCSCGMRPVPPRAPVPPEEEKTSSALPPEEQDALLRQMEAVAEGYRSGKYPRAAQAEGDGSIGLQSFPPDSVFPKEIRWEALRLTRPDPTRGESDLIAKLPLENGYAMEFCFFEKRLHTAQFLDTAEPVSVEHPAENIENYQHNRLTTSLYVLNYPELNGPSDDSRAALRYDAASETLALTIAFSGVGSLQYEYSARTDTVAPRTADNFVGWDEETLCYHAKNYLWLLRGLDLQYAPTEEQKAVLLAGAQAVFDQYRSGEYPEKIIENSDAIQFLRPFPANCDIPKTVSWENVDLAVDWEDEVHFPCDITLRYPLSNGQSIEIWGGTRDLNMLDLLFLTAEFSNTP